MHHRISQVPRTNTIATLSRIFQWERKKNLSPYLTTILVSHSTANEIMMEFKSRSKLIVAIEFTWQYSTSHIVNSLRSPHIPGNGER